MKYDIKYVLIANNIQPLTDTQMETIKRLV